MLFSLPPRRLQHFADGRASQPAECRVDRLGLATQAPILPCEDRCQLSHGGDRVVVERGLEKLRERGASGQRREDLDGQFERFVVRSQDPPGGCCLACDQVIEGGSELGVGESGPESAELAMLSHAEFVIPSPSPISEQTEATPHGVKLQHARCARAVATICIVRRHTVMRFTVTLLSPDAYTVHPASDRTITS